MIMNFRAFEKTWVIAEIGVNHEGDAEIAHRLLDAAADAGADAVKFQTYTPEGYISRVQPERLERVRRFALSHEQFRALSQHATRREITFFSTPLAIEDVDFLDGIAPIFKVASGDLTYLDLIHHIATKGKPIILSTGLGLEDEIRAAINTVLAVRPQAHDDGSLMLLHCVTAYPTPAEEAHLRNIRWLLDRFGLPVGYSDHTLGTKACELAVAVGAVAVEKHFTDCKEGRAFRDHQLSADSADMVELIANIRQAETFLGRYERQRGATETDNMVLTRRSVAALVDIPEGATISRDMLTCLRPMWGVPAEKIAGVVGGRVLRAIPAGDIIRAEDVAT
jgi:N,N'-diacetyllegionaminate synthase